MYELKGQPLLPRSRFLRRLLAQVFGVILLTVTLLLGIAVFGYDEGQPWHQAF